MDEEIGKRLKLARETKKLDAAEAAHRMGIAYSTLKNHEDGQRGAKRRLVDYARIYGVNLVWLASGAGPMKGSDPLMQRISELDGTDREHLEDYLDLMEKQKNRTS